MIEQTEIQEQLKLPKTFAFHALVLHNGEVTTYSYEKAKAMRETLEKIPMDAKILGVFKGRQIGVKLSTKIELGV